VVLFAEVIFIEESASHARNADKNSRWIVSLSFRLAHGFMDSTWFHDGSLPGMMMRKVGVTMFLRFIVRPVGQQDVAGWDGAEAHYAIPVAPPVLHMHPKPIAHTAALATAFHAVLLILYLPLINPTYHPTPSSPTPSTRITGAFGSAS
jgi:hypothetical protein